MAGFLSGIGGWFVSLLTGGTLDKILDLVDKKFDAGTEQERIKAEVVETWIKAQANLLVGRTWWFQLFFVIPLGVWWSSVIFDCITHVHVTSALPPPLDSWAGWIISALFLIDGSKAIMGRLGK